MTYSTVNRDSVSKLTLGTAQLGMDYGIYKRSVKPGSKESMQIIDYALQSGINTLDTARDYGNAEQILGDFMVGGFGTEAMIVTKFKISPSNLPHIERARAEVYESVYASLAALRLSQIPICLFHKDKDQPIELVIKILPGILTSLVDDGLIDTGGISVYHPEEVRQALEHTIIKAIQVPMNVFDQRLMRSGLLQQMYDDQKIIFVRSVFLKGLLFIQPENLSGSLIEAGNYLTTLHKIANQSGISVAQLAFSYVRDMEEITSIVFGAENVEQVQQTLQLLQGSAIDTNTRQTIETIFQNIPESIIVPGLWTT